MKNPFRAERGTLTSGRACAVYALAFVLMLFLDAARFSSFLDRAGIDFPPAAVVGQAVKGVAEATGLAAFSGAETRLVAAFNTDKPIGAVEGPSAAPSTAPQRPVADALADFSREAASPVQPEPPAEEVPVEVPVSVPPVAVPEQATPAAQPETGGLPPVRAETGRKPLVLLVGDSMMMEGFGPVLQRTLRKRPDLEVVREGKYSTGLSRQDYFDWPAQLEKLVEKHNPDMVVICMGANDPQDIIDENRKRHHADSESWKAVYRSRAERLLAVATAKGAKAVWVGLPVMGKEPYSTRVRRLSRLQQEACETYHAVFVDTVKVLADAQGNYTTFKVDGKGRHVRLRYKDMVHVTEDGGAMLSAAVEPVVEKELLLGRGKAAERSAPQALPSSLSSSSLPAASLPVAAEASVEQGGIPFAVDSAFRGGKIPCYAFLPADRKPGERFPVVYLLHGAFEDAGVWNTRAGALLSKLAARERLVFIAPSCGRTGWYADSPYLKKNRIESFFVRELMPYVERAFPVLPKRGVMGMSMGGHGSFVLALRHPGTFASVSSMSGVMDITRHPAQWKIRDVLGPMKSNKALWQSYSAEELLKRSKAAGMPAMLITTGQQDAYVVPENRAFRDTLRRGGFSYQYREAPGLHDWTYWLDELPLHAAFHAGVLHR